MVPNFPPTPYEFTLQAYLKTTGVDLRQAYADVLQRRGPAIDEPSLYEELRDHAGLMNYMMAVVRTMQVKSIDLETHFQLYVKSEALHLWSFFLHFSGGEKVFRIHENLAKALNDTSLRVPSAYLNLPFDGLCLSYEGNVLEVAGALQTGTLDSCYLTSKSGGAKNMGSNCRRGMFYSKGSQFMEASVGVNLVSLGQGDDLVDESFLTNIVAPGVVEDPRFELMLLALKTVAYINSGGSDLLERPPVPKEIQALLSDPATAPPGEERKKLQRRAERSSQQPYIYVGSRLPTPTEPEVSIPGPGVHKLTYRFMVRGHFHGYWKKKENLIEDERSWIQQEAVEDGQVWILVLKWIHPYEKGPTEAEKIHRRYYVQ
jgi:hypothetical protein